MAHEMENGAMVGASACRCKESKVCWMRVYPKPICSCPARREDGKSKLRKMMRKSEDGQGKRIREVADGLGTRRRKWSFKCCTE
jgi:hypothetical protein